MNFHSMMVKLCYYSVNHMRARPWDLFMKCTANKLPIHSKKCWVVSNQIWVKYGETQRWVKNAIKKITVERES